jgi:hypothetical protein
MLTVCHTWTDGSFRESVGLGWIITEDNIGAGPADASNSFVLKKVWYITPDRSHITAVGAAP